MSRINNDIGEIQRDRVGDGARVAGQRAVPGRHGRVCWRGWICGCSLVTIARRAARRCGRWCTIAQRLEAGSQRRSASAARTSAASSSRRCRRCSWSPRQRAGPRGQALPRAQRRLRRRADVDAAAHLLRRRRARADHLRSAPVSTFVYGGFRVIERRDDRRDVRRVHGLPDAAAVAAAGAAWACTPAWRPIRVSLRRVAQILDEPVEVVEQPSAEALERASTAT
mgnify:CR=1 FL=1